MPDKKKHAAFAALKPIDRKLVEYGAALMRIADGLDRSHASAISKLDCSIAKHGVTVEVKSPVDIQLELWTARDKKAAFEKVFGKTIEFVKR
ncbi:MAG: hypothetical protein QM754_11030 [Tepidisphaeraceae bacterium]